MQKKTKQLNPNLIIPVGTYVVARKEIRNSAIKRVRPMGEVGIVIKAPADNTHSYRVRFPDGEEATLLREEFEIFKHFQRQGLTKNETILRDYNLYDCVIYRCIVGSKAYGLDEEDSDKDIRGIYLSPADMHWSLYGVPEQLENQETQECYWELQKFMVLALKANPNVLECFHTPLIEKATPLATELLSMKSIFLSKLVYQTYNGYVMSQFKKIEVSLRNKGAIRWKHAMHLIRLLLSGIKIMKEGFVLVDVGAYKGKLLAIRRGELSWEKINAWRVKLHREFEEAFLHTKLPEQPDYEKANAFLIKARRSAVSDEFGR